MKHLEIFESYNESFDVVEISSIGDLSIGDEVFKLGNWLFVKDLGDDWATLISDSGVHSKISQSDLNKMKMLKKHYE